MNKKIRQHLTSICLRQGLQKDRISDYVLLGVLCGSEEVACIEEYRARRWTVYKYVVDVDGMLIGFHDARSDGDMSATKRGFEFDFSTIHEVRAVEKTVIVYEQVDEGVA